MFAAWVRAVIHQPEAPAIVVRGLGRRLGGVDVLEDVDLRVEPGELLCVVGAGGSGKSTLLRIVAGLERGDRGAVTIDGEPVTGPSSDRAILLEDDRLRPWLTVARNVGLGLGGLPAPERRERVASAIRLVGLSGLEGASPRRLSAGMARRAALARLLARHPRVLLLDDPFRSLDAVARARLQEELLRIWQAERPTVILVTHDVDEAVFLADRVAVMSGRPGTIRRVVDVDLPRPRDRAGSGCADVRRRVWRELAAEPDPDVDFQI